jgi:hypothetical protein
MNFFAGKWEVDVGGNKLRIDIDDVGNNLIRIRLMDTTTVIGFGRTLSVGNTPIMISFFRRDGTDIHFYAGEVERNEDPPPGSTIRPTRVRGRHLVMSASPSALAPLDDEWTGTRPPE